MFALNALLNYNSEFLLQFVAAMQANRLPTYY